MSTSTKIPSKQHNSRPSGVATRSWKRRLGISAICLIVLILSAPTLVLQTPLRQQLVPWAAPHLTANVKIGGASGGWFTSIVFHDVVINDASGELLLKVKTVRCDKSVIGFLSDSNQLGRFRIEKPKVRLTMWDDGSNIETALEEILKQPSSGSSPTFTVEVADGRVEIVSILGKTAGTLDKLMLKLNSPDNQGTPLEIHFTANISDTINTGQLTATYSQQHGMAEGIKLELHSIKAPVDAVQPLFDRLIPGLEISTIVDGNITATVMFDGGSPNIFAKGSILTGPVRVFAPQWFGTDQLRANSLKLTGGVDLNDGNLFLRNLDLQSELANAQLTGTLNVEKLDASDTVKLLHHLAEHDSQAKVQIDLTKLAATLPHTIHLRENTSLEQGTVDLTWSSHEVPGVGRTWNGQLATTDIVGWHDQQRIEWRKPFSISIGASPQPSGPALHQLKCTADFCRLEGTSQGQQVTLEAKLNLNKLAQQLGQIVNLSHLELAGELDANLTGQRTKNNYALDATINANSVNITWPNWGRWQDQDLTAKLSTAAQLNGMTIKQVDRASLQLIDGPQQIIANLTQPVADPRNATLPLAFSIQGDLAKWYKLLDPLLPTNQWKPSGTINAMATVLANNEQINIQSSDIRLANFRADGNGFRINEPQLNCQTVGKCDLANKNLELGITLAGTALTFRSSDLKVSWKDNIAAKCSLDYRANTGAISQWLPPDFGMILAGGAAGRLVISHNSQNTAIQNNIDIASLALYQTPAGNEPNPPLWQEQKITLDSDIHWLAHQQRLEIRKLSLNNGAAVASVRGEIDNLLSTADAKLTGRIDYDLQKLLPRLKGIVPAGIKATGIQAENFSLSGPLRPSDDGTQAILTSAGGQQVAEDLWVTKLSAQGGMGWKSLNLYGIQVGAGELNLALKQGYVTSQPLDLRVSEGQLKVETQTSLLARPYTLTARPGRMIDNVRFSPEMCDGWLRYVAPIVADATKIEGRFSADLQSVAIPVLQPEKADVGGRLTIHSATILPGPLAEHYLTMGRQLESIIRGKPVGSGGSAMIQMPEQQIDLLLRKGRVYHRGLRMQAGDLLIVTQGSVGIDQSLDLVAIIPIADAWIAGKPVLAGLKGQTIQIPIRGTISSPKLDQQAIGQLAERIAGSAASTLIENELQKGFNRLFSP